MNVHVRAYSRIRRKITERKGSISMMKMNLLLCFCLAALIFLIPLAVLGVSMPVSSSETNTVSNSAVAESESNQTEGDVSSVTLSDDTFSSEQLMDLPQANSFTIYDQTTGELHQMTAEAYTICAVSAEMPPTFSPEALRAQAVASYTYALRAKYDNQKTSDPSLQGADFAADPSNWKGFATREQYIERYGEEDGAAYWEQITKAVEPVLGYVMLYQERPIVAAFHSISAGVTEDASNVWSGTAPYLVPVESPGDQYAPGYETAELFEPEALTEAFISAGLTAQNIISGSPDSWFTSIQRTPSGYVTDLNFCGQSISGMEIRNALGLRSTNFTIEYLNGSFLVRVCGYGHGVGMSQYGAEYLGRQGKSWEEILRHYYTGVEIVKLKR